MAPLAGGTTVQVTSDVFNVPLQSSYTVADEEVPSSPSYSASAPNEGSGSLEEPSDSYGPPRAPILAEETPLDTYGPPRAPPIVEAPSQSYGAPAAPVVEAPSQSYGAPAAPPLSSYQSSQDASIPPPPPPPPPPQASHQGSRRPQRPRGGYSRGKRKSRFYGQRTRSKGRFPKGNRPEPQPLKPSHHHKKRPSSRWPQLGFFLRGL